MTSHRFRVTGNYKQGSCRGNLTHSFGWVSLDLNHMMWINSSGFPSNQSASHDNKTSRTQDLQLLCPPFPNTLFEMLDNTLPYFINAALNVPLAVATTFANLVVLLAMRRVTSIRLPSKVLLCSLVLSDLGAGSVVQPQFAAFMFFQASYPHLVPCPLYASWIFTSGTFGTASLWTLAVISLDRYAALFFHLQYQQIVTTRRVCTAIAFIWAYALIWPLAALFDIRLFSTVLFTGALVALLIISVACIKISRRLRAQKIQPQPPDQAQQQAGTTLNMARYRRTASAMMWICVIVLICYLPVTCMGAFRSVKGTTALIELLVNLSYSLVLLNSLLNPFVYCLRLPEIRTEVTKQLHKLFCRSGSAQ